MQKQMMLNVKINCICSFKLFDYTYDFEGLFYTFGQNDV